MQESEGESVLLKVEAWKMQSLELRKIIGIIGI